MTDPAAAASRAGPARAKARAALVHYLAWLDAEHRRIRAMIRSFDADRPAREGPRPQDLSSGTFRLLRRFIATIPPGEPFTPGDAYQFLIGSGEWRTGADDPRAAVSSSMAHLAEPGRKAGRMLDRGPDPKQGIYYRFVGPAPPP